MSNVKRKPISPSLRFDVLEKDNFTCQYCGAKSVDDNVLLEVDHIVPVSKGGDNNIENLVTSCKKCNIGKSAKKLGAKKRLTLRQKEIKELEQRREQQEMYLKSRLNKKKESEPLVNYIHNLYANYNIKLRLNLLGENRIFALYKKIGFEQVVNLIEDNEHYLHTDLEGSQYEKSAANEFIDKIEEGGNKLYKKQNYKEGVGNLSAYFVAIVNNRTEDWREWEVSNDLIALLKPLDKDNKIELLKQKLIPYAKEIPKGSSYQGSYMYIEDICNREIKRLGDT
tara:strand:+ start:1868 stop:2713 length:846 start_codon:yes stop_codon:yes gene_type:complete